MSNALMEASPQPFSPYVYYQGSSIALKLPKIQEMGKGGGALRYLLGYYIDFNLLVRPLADSEHIHLFLTAHPDSNLSPNALSMGGGVSSLMVGSQAASAKDAHTNDPITPFKPGPSKS